MLLSEWAVRFKEFCLEAELIRLTRRDPGAPCAGGYDPHSGRWDPMLDRKYHADNPSAPVCVEGRIGAAETTEDVHAFVSVGLSEQQQLLLPLAEFKVDDMLYLGPADTYLMPIVGENDSSVSEMEFPVGSGWKYRLIQPDRYWFRGSPIYWYVRLQGQARDT